MHNITIIFTVHRENGLCSSDELYKIFEHIKPDVIFEEIPPCRFDAYYKEHSLNTLETDTIKKYLINNNIKNIPVDKDYEMSEAIKDYENYYYLNDIFFSYSDDFNILWNKNIEMVNQYGFMYLNSKKYTEISKKLQSLEESIIKYFNSKELMCRFNIWVYNMFERDITMLNNIYSYCKNNNFSKGIFTIGAEQKISIINIIEKNKNNENKINWIYDNYEFDIQT